MFAFLFGALVGLSLVLYGFWYNYHSIVPVWNHSQADHAIRVLRRTSLVRVVLIVTMFGALFHVIWNGIGSIIVF